jgi:hypothetical protein
MSTGSYARWTRVAAFMAAVAATLALVATVSAAPAAAAPTDPWLGLAGLQTMLNASPTGVSGHLKTVMGGGAGAASQTPVNIDLTVLAIVGNAGPDGALIMFKVDLADPDLQGVPNIAAGMSGSPLYVSDGGTDKVIGALSYGDSFTTAGLGLATPIEYMIAIENTYPITAAGGAARRSAAPAALGTAAGYTIAALPDSPALAAEAISRVVVARDAGAADPVPRPAGTVVFAPLSTVQIGGLPYESSAYKRIAAQLTARGHTVLRGLGTGPEGWDPDFQTALIPGAACAAMYTRGDFWAGGTGTVTYVNGSTLLAFGHPFDWTGPSGLYLDNAWIDGVWGSMAASYKVSEPGKVRGTVTQDRGSGIGARLDQTPVEAPVTSKATVTSGGVTRTATSQTWMTRYVADKSLGAYAAQSAVSVPIYRAGDVLQMAGGAQTTTVVKVSDGTTPYTVTRANVWDNPVDIAYDATTDVADVLWALTDNLEGVAPATVLSVDYQTSISPQRLLATIVDVAVPGGLTVGDNTVYVTLAPYGSVADVIVPVKLTIPEGTSTEGGLLVSSVRESGGDMPGGLSARAAATDAAGDAATHAVVAPRATRTSLAELVSDLNAAPNNADIKLTYQTSAPQPVVAYGRTAYYISGALSASTTSMQMELSPKTADYGARTITVSGIIGSVAGPSTVAIYKRAAGASDWTLVQDDVSVDLQSDGSGAFLIALTGPKYSTTYKAVWNGDARTLGATAQAKLSVRARVTLDGRALSSGAVKFTVQVAPNQAGKMVSMEKKAGKSWVRVALLKLKSNSSLNWTWRPKAGTYHMRAHFLGNSSSAESASASLKVIVH